MSPNYVGHRGCELFGECGRPARTAIRKTPVEGSPGRIIHELIRSRLSGVRVRRNCRLRPGTFPK